MEQIQHALPTLAKLDWLLPIDVEVVSWWLLFFTHGTPKKSHLVLTPPRDALDWFVFNLSIMFFSKDTNCKRSKRNIWNMGEEVSQIPRGYKKKLPNWQQYGKNHNYKIL